MKPIRHYYLGNADEIAAAMTAVAAQGKAEIISGLFNWLFQEADLLENAVGFCTLRPN